jgi:hypothetical protein
LAHFDFTWEYSVANNAATITRYNGGNGSVTIPSTLNGYPVRGIGGGTFNGRSGVTSVSIPDSVRTIYTYAFAGCGLTNLSIPNSVMSIGSGAFFDCTSLTSVSIPPRYLSTLDQLFNALSIPAVAALASNAVTETVSQVQANPAAYNLFTSDSIMDLRMGGMMLQKHGGNAVVSFQPQTTTDLTQPFTNNGPPITNTIPMPGNKGFLRIQSK